MNKLVLVLFFCFIAVGLMFGCTRDDKSADTNNLLGNTVSVESVIDCDTNLSCFINELENNHLSQVNYTVTVDIFQIKQTTASYLELKEFNGNNVVLYIRNIDSDAQYPVGVPQEVIDNSRKIYDLLKGRDGNCLFAKSDLLSMLKEWQLGNFTTSDWQVAQNCSGKYFETFVMDSNGEIINNNLNELPVAEENVTSCLFHKDCPDGVCIDSKCLTPETIEDCASISFSLDKQQCIKIIALKSNNESLCSTMVSASTYSTVQSDCFGELAVKNNDLNVCNIEKFDAIKSYPDTSSKLAKACVEKYCKAYGQEGWIWCPAE